MVLSVQKLGIFHTLFCLPFIVSLALLSTPPPLPFFPLFLFHFSLDPSLSLLPTLLSLCA